MNLVKFNPTSPSKSIFEEMFDDFFGGETFWDAPMRYRFTEPLANISEDKDKFEIELAVPGMTKEDIKINIENDQLVISAKRESKNEQTDKDFKRREFFYGTFTKSFHLPDSVDRNQVNARFENGILAIDLMKKEEAIEKGPLHIEIK